MKQGYIVINLTTYGDGFEVFGVYRTLEKAEKVYAKVCRNRCIDPETGGELIDGDSYRIIQFSEHDGREQ